MRRRADSAAASSARRSRLAGDGVISLVAGRRVPSSSARTSICSSRSASAVPSGTVADRRSRSARRTSGRSRNAAPPRNRWGMPASRSASAIRWVWAWVRTSTACSDHGRPGARARRMARAMAIASARSVGWPCTRGGAPSARVEVHVPGRLPGPAEHRRGAVEDLRRGAVAALELDHLGGRPPPVDVEEEPGVGAVPPVDRLLRVAHRGDVVAVASPRLEQPELQRVDVLELVDEQVAEPPALRGGEGGRPPRGPGRRGRAGRRSRPARRGACGLVGGVDLGDQVGLERRLADRSSPPPST